MRKFFKKAKRRRIIIKLKQLFCRHKKVSPMRKEQLYFNLSGETVYYVCDKCEKSSKRGIFK